MRRRECQPGFADATGLPIAECSLWRQAPSHRSLAVTREDG
ncbi:hypothetical protein [Lentzea alba]|nr:hypothetical protein [Lentzea alba]